MKTRIRVIEYNSGIKEYVCEYKSARHFFYSLLSMHPFAIPLFFVYWIDGWDYLIIADKENIANNKKAVFNTMEEAKAFIDNYLLGYNASQELFRQSQVKTISFIKHP